MERRLAIITVIASAFLAISFTIGFAILAYAIITTFVNTFCYALLLIITYPIKSIFALGVGLIMILSYKSILTLIKK